MHHVSFIYLFIYYYTFYNLFYFIEPFWLLVTYGALVCYECGAIHAKLESSSVKSVHYDSWLVSDSMVNTKYNDISIIYKILIIM